MIRLASIRHPIRRAAVRIRLRVVATPGVLLMAEWAHALRACQANRLILKVVIILPIIAVIVHVGLASVGHDLGQMHV